MLQRQERLQSIRPEVNTYTSHLLLNNKGGEDSKQIREIRVERIEARDAGEVSNI